MSKKIPVLITTDKKGVFFGYINPADKNNDQVYADNIQMCIYWSKNVRGIIGLSSSGPDKKSRVTAAAPKGVIKGINMILECTPKAVKNWQAQPWGN